MTSLAELRKNEQAEIVEISEMIPMKIYDFNFYIGQKIKVVQKGAFNGPIICEIEHSKVAIRKSDSKLITIKVSE